MNRKHTPEDVDLSPIRFEEDGEEPKIAPGRCANIITFLSGGRRRCPYSLFNGEEQCWRCRHLTLTEHGQ